MKDDNMFAAIAVGISLIIMLMIISDSNSVTDRKIDKIETEFRADWDKQKSENDKVVESIQEKIGALHCHLCGWARAYNSTKCQHCGDVSD